MYRNVNLSFKNKNLLDTIQQKYAPSEAQSLCANNGAASAFMTRVKKHTARVWTLISKQPDAERKMLNIFFDIYLAPLEKMLRKKTQYLR